MAYAFQSICAPYALKRIPSTSRIRHGDVSTVLYTTQTNTQNVRTENPVEHQTKRERCYRGPDIHRANSIEPKYVKPSVDLVVLLLLLLLPVLLPLLALEDTDDVDEARDGGETDGNGIAADLVSSADDEEEDDEEADEDEDEDDDDV